LLDGRGIASRIAAVGCSRLSDRRGYSYVSGSEAERAPGVCKESRGPHSSSMASARAAAAQRNMPNAGDRIERCLLVVELMRVCAPSALARSPRSRYVIAISPRLDCQSPASHWTMCRRSAKACARIPATRVRVMRRAPRRYLLHVVGSASRRGFAVARAISRCRRTPRRGDRVAKEDRSAERVDRSAAAPIRQCGVYIRSIPICQLLNAILISTVRAIMRFEAPSAATGCPKPIPG